MKAYFMLGQSVPMGFAVIAALDIPEIIGRLTGSAETQYSLLDDREFERVGTYLGAIVLSSKLHEGREVAIAFGPREVWPEEFGRFRDYLVEAEKWFVEAEKREEERQNITAEKWLTCDRDPISLANFVLPRFSERKTRLFAVACCDLAADRMIDPRSRRAAEVALAHANRAASDEELKAAADGARQALWAIRNAQGREGADQSSPEHHAAFLAVVATHSFDRTRTPDSLDGWDSDMIWHTMQVARDDPLIAEKVTGHAWSR